MEREGTKGRSDLNSSAPGFDLEDAAHVHFLFQAVWESAVDAMALSDPRGIVLAVNPAYCQLYGYPVEELVGQSFAVIFPEDQRTQAEADYRRYFVDAVHPAGVEATVQSTDGEEHLVDVRYSFIDQAGQRIAMLSVIRDVTDRARLRQSERDLLRDKDNFVLAISHDLKTPITAIKGHAQLLLRRLTPGADPDVGKLTTGLRQIETTATQMSQMIDGLLDVSSLRRGETLQVNRTNVDLVALVRVVVAGQNGISDRHRFEVDAPDALTGRWDEARLTRVIDNLVANALKYSPAGGTILIALREAVEAHGRMAILSVTDNGIGIPDDDRERIFDPFYRGSNVTEQVTGSGIGLAGVRQIVELHGGTVSVESMEGKGTTFTVRLPTQPV
jgi:PAS domain S-box-containing protein